MIFNLHVLCVESRGFFQERDLGRKGGSRVMLGKLKINSTGKCTPRVVFGVVGDPSITTFLSIMIWPFAQIT